MNRILLILLSTSLTGCFFFGNDGPMEPKGPSIADALEDLPEVAMPEVRMPPPTREDVMTAYREVYGLMPDSLENHAVGRRLADLEMEIGEEKDIVGDDQPYAAAISLYEELLAGAQGEDRDQILYQLARAYDVVGEREKALDYLDRMIAEHPDSDFMIEARFRRAEMLFSDENYADAAPDYGYVVANGRDSQYWQNSLYMLGWCQFKESDLDESVASFLGVVADMHANELSGDRGEQELMNDTLRVIVLASSYLDGAETVADHMDRLDRPDWQYKVYERLAADYREQERWLDSVATLETFIQRNTLDRRAPVFHQQVIDTLISADFPSEIRPRKEDFIVRYGIRSEFWEVHDAESRADYMPILKKYLDEMSKLSHSEAQKSKKQDDYVKAADYYEQLVVTFPEDPSLPDSLFLLGEVYTEAGDPARSVSAYQRVAREFPEHPQASEAGYAAILGLTQVLDEAPAEDRELWERVKIDAQIEFAMMFPGDERAATVQADAADALFGLEQYKQAMELADHLVRTQENLDPDLARTAYSIMGHGAFELAQYGAAESAYRSLLILPPDEEVSHEEINEKLLATIYKQAEVADTNGDADAAVYHFMRIKAEAPDSELAVKGHFDAIAVVEAQGNQAAAAELLESFRSDYPGHELGKDTAKRLANLYEQTENWDRAASEFSRIAETDPDVEVRRQALYRAGELYLDLDDIQNALVTFTQYANAYPEPVDLRVESMQKLDELYQRTNDPVNRRVWLRKKIQLAENLGNKRSERLTWMAAEAEFVLAEDVRIRFDSIEIKHPLKDSLKRKTAVMKETTAAFERVASWDVQEFQTAATYQIADMYASLSRSLMESDRPAGLNDLELEQYEILLEEQAFPFEEQAISLHEINMRRSWDGVYDDWVEKSFASLRVLMPGRFDKEELQVGYVKTIR